MKCIKDSIKKININTIKFYCCCILYVNTEQGQETIDFINLR